MKVFFTYQGIEKKFFYEFNVSSSLTVEEFIQFTQIKEILIFPPLKKILFQHYLLGLNTG